MLNLLMIAAVTATSGPATVKSGVENWRTGNHAAAVAAWLPFAAQGDADALFNMGQAYKLGRGVTRDPAVARDYYRKAAAKGHLPAQANLGITLFQAGDKAEAVRWLKTAADRGEARAQYVYGIAAYNGDGTPKNAALAYGYLLRAREAKLAQAATALQSIEPVLSAETRTAGEAVAASLASGAGVPVIAPKPILTRLADALRPVPAPRAAPPAPAPQTAAIARPPIVAAPVPAPQIAANTVPSPAPIPVQAPPPKPAAVVITPPPPRAAVVAGTLAPSRPAPVAWAVTTPRPAPIAAAPPPAPATTVARADVAPKAVLPPAPQRSRDWRVQLGAFSSQKQADAAWTAVRTTQGSAIGKAKPIFDTTGTVVKVQLGPYASRDAARDACAKLAFAGRACFVTQG